MGKLYNLVIGTASSLLLTFSAQAQIMTTVAGNGVAGYEGDGGQATMAKLFGPTAITIDTAGNLYICEQYNNTVRMVNKSTGVITTVAGNDTAGYSGDSSLAIHAKLNNPSGIAVDAAGNIYIADMNNAVIRKVTTDGKIYTIAGTGVQGYNGDGLRADSAKLNHPAGVAVDAAGNIFIADKLNNRVRKISAATGKISTIAGNGAAGYNSDLWPAATQAWLNQPTCLSMDKMGQLYIADEANNRIRKLDTFGKISSVVTGLVDVTSVVADLYGNIYYTDRTTCRIAKCTPLGLKVPIAGTGSSGFAADSSNARNVKIGGPTGITVDANANIYFSEWSNNRVRRISSTLGINDEPATASGIEVYPNPVSNGQFSLQLNGERGDMLVLIRNIAGQVVYQQQGKAGQKLTINAPLADGIYVVTASTANGTWSRKVEIASRR